jgi:hypothetical protein
MAGLYDEYRSTLLSEGLKFASRAPLTLTVSV